MRISRSHVVALGLGVLTAGLVVVGTTTSFAATNSAGKAVCQGQRLTHSGEGGRPAASSNQFPIGTRLKVTNLDNDKTTTVEVTSVSGSCLLLNAAAMDLVREPGKEVVRRNMIQRISGNANPTRGKPAAGSADTGNAVCEGQRLTHSGEGGPPAASSNQFPIGTRLKVTNLDNDKTTTVEVTSVSGSCLLLNTAAMDLVREPGKEVIRRNLIRRVG